MEVIRRGSSRAGDQQRRAPSSPTRYDAFNDDSVQRGDWNQTGSLQNGNEANCRFVTHFSYTDPIL